jgi:hypothetical protein
MENRNLNAADSKRRQGYYGGHRGVVNQYAPIHLANNTIYNQLGLEIDLHIDLGANICLYVNQLNYQQLSELIASFPNDAIKPSDKKQDRPINWLAASSFSQFGKNPMEVFKDAIALYDSFDIEKESKRKSSYGITSVSMNFAKLPLVKAKEDGLPAYPFGILFFSDLNNFNATISTISDRKKDVAKCPYINPVSYDYRGTVSCTGKYRLRGNYIIFYVNKEIEKQEGLSSPDVTIISIPVSASRDQKDWTIIKSTFACNIKRANNCIYNFIDYIVKDICGFYGLTDPQSIAEIIHAFGYEPVDYGYPPSISDEQSKYYGGNHVHMGTRNNLSREKPLSPYNYKKDIFSYLSEINKKNEASIVVPASPKEGEDEKNKGNRQSKKANSGKNKGNEPTQKNSEQVPAEPMVEENSEEQPQPQESPVSYSAEEIDAAFGSAVASSPPIVEEENEGNVESQPEDIPEPIEEDNEIFIEEGNGENADGEEKEGEGIIPDPDEPNEDIPEDPHSAPALEGDIAGPDKSE